MAHFYVRLLLIITLACALSAYGIAAYAETSARTSVTALQKQAPSCRRYGLCRGMFGLYQSHPSDDIAHQGGDGQVSAP